MLQNNVIVIQGQKDLNQVSSEGWGSKEGVVLVHLTCQLETSKEWGQSGQEVIPKHTNISIQIGLQLQIWN